MTTSITIPQTSYGFVGRRDELNLFADGLDALQAGRAYPRFLHFYGTAGIGKTRLLMEYKGLCRQRGVAAAYVSFEEDRMRHEVEEPYAEALFIVATQLADLGLEPMRQLMTERDVLNQRRLASQDLQEIQSARQMLKDFPNKWLAALSAIAERQPVVLFVDGLEDATDIVRGELESHLLVRLAAAPLAMVVSASRAALPATWSQGLQDRFDKINLSPLSEREVDQLLGQETVPHLATVRGGPLGKYVYEIGHGHPVVSRLVAEFLCGVVAGEKDPSAVTDLTDEQLGRLLEYLNRRYLDRYALRDLDSDPWAERVYKTVVPMRYFDLPLLERFLLTCRVERRGADETVERAVDRLEERGLVHWNPPGNYQLDPIPRDLLVRQMKHAEVRALRTVTEALVDLYRFRVFVEGEVADRPLATVEYLYHLCVHEELQDVSRARIETDLLEELNRCLERNRLPQAINSLWRYLKGDDELGRVFGLSLKTKVIATVERLSQTDTGVSSLGLEEDRATLIREVLNGHCVLFVGPGLSLGPDYLAVYADLALRLAEESGCKESLTRFEDVAQHYLTKRTWGELVARIDAYLGPLLHPDRASFDALVSLPFHVIVTTATDRSLEDAYERARWPVKVIVSPTAALKTERGEDLLIKLCGSTDRPDSLVWTRRQELQLRMNLASADNLLESYLGNRVPLFIGFSMQDPLLYVLHTLVHRNAGSLTRRSFLAPTEPRPFFNEAWQTDLVVLNQSSQDLLREFQECWQDWQSEAMRVLSGAEVLEAVQAGRSVAGRRLNRMVLEEGTDLQGQDLRHCVITSSILNGVLLNYASLDGADLSNAMLEDVQFMNCRANRVNLTYSRANRARLNRAQFSKALFTGAAMQDVEIAGAVFAESDLVYADLRGAKGDAVAFVNANLTGIDLSGAQLPGAMFRGSLVWGGKFKRARLVKSDFTMANIAKADFAGADLTGVNFYFSYLAGADFSGADIRGANFSQAWLEEADFRNARNVLEANFTNAVWQKAKLPDALRQQLEQHEADTPPAHLLIGKLVELTHEVLNGRCVLFIGPGLTLGPQYMDTYARITTHLAAECDWTEEKAGLQDVSQYYGAKKGLARLLKRVSEEILSDLQPDETSLDLVVSLPFDVIVTTAVDTLLEEAYERARRPYERAASVSESVVAEEGEGLLVRLCGGIDVPNSPLVLTRRDRLQLQTRLAQSGNLLSRYIGTRVPLFIGFSLRDPMLYMLHTLIGRPDAPLAGKSFVAHDESHPFLGEAWQSEGLVVLDRSSRHLLEGLQRQWFERRDEALRIWTADEILEAIRAGRSIAGKHMAGIALEEGANLQGQDLRNCVITAGILDGVLLNDALLSGADLSNATMEDAQLCRCQLLGANMVYAKANRARLVNADLGQASLVYAALQDVDLAGARLVEADLIFSDLQGAFGEDIDFTRARLSDALLSGVQMPAARFRDSFCAKAQFKRAKLVGADFQMANLAEAKFEGADLSNANFRAANLTDADFSGADLRSADFTQARLDGADFHDAKNLMETTLVDAAWQKAKLPDEVRQRLEDRKRSRPEAES